MSIPFPQQTQGTPPGAMTIPTPPTAPAQNGAPPAPYALPGQQIDPQLSAQALSQQQYPQTPMPQSIQQPGTASGSTGLTGLPREYLPLVEEALRANAAMVRSQISREIDTLRTQNQTLGTENSQLRQTVSNLEGRVQSMAAAAPGTDPNVARQLAALEDRTRTAETMVQRLKSEMEEKDAKLREAEERRSLDAYRASRLALYGSQIPVQMHDLVRGNSVEEIERSLADTIERATQLLRQFQGTNVHVVPGAPPQPPAPTPVQPVQGFPWIGQPTSQGQRVAIPDPRAAAAMGLHGQAPFGQYPTAPIPASPPAQPTQPVVGTPAAPQVPDGAIASMAGFDGTRPGGAYNQNRDALLKTFGITPVNRRA